jgi:hypothetical protein
LAIYDTMQYIRPRSRPLSRAGGEHGGLAARAGRAASASRCRTLAIMIHQPLGGVQGQAVDIDIQAREILRLREQMNNILVKHTGQSLKKIEKDTDRDLFMTGKAGGRVRSGRRGHREPVGQESVSGVVWRSTAMIAGAIWSVRSAARVRTRCASS